MGARTLSFVGLGSNVGGRLGMIQAASERLRALDAGAVLSPVYETAPIGPPQPDYLNAVMALHTPTHPFGLPAPELLEALLAVERSLGRERKERWGPRTIDLDLLAVGDQTVDLPGLTVPHPEIRHRAFVLRPWLDLAPTFVIPGQGTVQALWDALPESEQRSVRPHVT